jgi:glucosamine 6-phosphate synthetase-like amidotransferase/phosphosugar isomerase protein
MCGIAATLLRPRQRSAEDWQYIKEVFTRNLLFNEARGKAATGLALVQVDGQVRVHKAPIPAHEFTTTPEYLALMEQVGAQTTMLLGHTRQPTKGLPDDNANNHPILTEYVVGIHNGHIDNDDALFAHYGWERVGSVDSEAIFRLLDMVDIDRCNGNYAQCAREHVQQLDGAFTTLSVDLRAPTRMLVLKRNNPLSYYYEPSLDALVFSSRYIFLRNEFGRVVVAEALARNSLYLFDAVSPADKPKHLKL